MGPVTGWAGAFRRWGLARWGAAWRYGEALDPDALRLVKMGFRAGFRAGAKAELEGDPKMVEAVKRLLGEER